MNPSLQVGLANTLGLGNGVGGQATAGGYGPFASGYVGATKAAPVSQVPDYAGEARSQYNDLLKQIQALSAPKPFTYSTFDTKANSAQARAQAEGAVNPLYQKKLTDFLAQQQTLQDRQQADTATNNANLQEALQSTLQANKISGERNSADTQTAINGINTNTDQFQQDSGTAFDKARLQLLRGSNDVGGGLDQAAANGQVANRNTQEARQVQTFQNSKDQANLLHQRTFEDLARSGDLATSQTGKATDQNNLSLSRFIQDIGTQNAAEKNTLEQQRLSDVLSQQQNYEKTGYSNFLNTLSGQNRANTAQVYGGLY